MAIWRHGTYVDLWSVVHLLSGISLALAGYGLGYELWLTVLVSLALLTAWEVFEWMVGIIEPSVNVGVDLVIGAAGLAIGAAWNYGLGNPFDPLAIATCLTLLLTLSVWGFVDFYFRGYH